MKSHRTAAQEALVTQGKGGLASLGGWGRPALPKVKSFQSELAGKGA